MFITNKFFISFLICFLISNVGFSQIFTVTELENLSQKNWDDFDTYVNKKGYVFDHNEAGTIVESKSYAYKPHGNDKAVKWITLHQFYDSYDQAKSSVTWQISKQSEYINLKSQIKLSGYKFIETGTFKGATKFEYRKGKKSITIYLMKEENDFGEKETIYEIDLSNNK